ncbi:MAG: N-acetyltransferase [Aquificae bacterium]|nr:N-acetyltransferase [Aquificota bacterium]
MLRKARVKDATEIHSLLSEYASRGLLLPRSLNSIYENIRDFWVYEKEGRVVGCVALHVMWEDLGEIRSLAVREEFQGEGIGGELVRACILEAWELGLRRVFSLTYVKDFFTRNFGFRVIDKSVLPHKVWGECINCVKFPNCDEEAVLLELSSEYVEKLRKRSFTAPPLRTSP